jgi:hypothetical protein
VVPLPLALRNDMTHYKGAARRVVPTTGKSGALITLGEAEAQGGQAVIEFTSWAPRRLIAWS